MEIYEAQNNFTIVKISRSSETLVANTNETNVDVKLSLTPYLILDEKEQIATAVLSSQFLKKDDTPLSNELVVRISYKFSNGLPLKQSGDDKVKVHNYEDLLSIFDTAIGIFRGILFEWLNGSYLQHPLPLVDIEEFVKGLRVSFSK